MTYEWRDKYYELQEKYSDCRVRLAETEKELAILKATIGQSPNERPI